MEQIPPNLPEEHLLKGQPRGSNGNQRVRFRNAQESLASAAQGVHRWWWECLRLSKDYWLVCQTSQNSVTETQDIELKRVYRAFGNIYDCTFDEWWIDRGSWVFREQERFPQVKEVARHPRDRAASTPQPDQVWVSIPLKLSRRTIQRQLSKILDAYEDDRLNNRLALSTSMFRLNPVQYRLHTLQKMHEVYSLHRELVDMPAALKALNKNGAFERRADLFRIGTLLKVSPSNESLRGDTDEIFKRQNRMRASVSRLLKRMELLVANVEEGIFPSFLPVAAPARPRFNSRQLESHKALEEQWWQLNLSSSLSAGKIEDARRIHYEEAMRMRQTSITEKRERIVKYS
jgi:hypothetical protein